MIASLIVDQHSFSIRVAEKKRVGGQDKVIEVCFHSDHLHIYES